MKSMWLVANSKSFH